MFDLIGETLRRLRKERGKTLEQLGAEAGLGRGQLSRIENARQEATLATLEKILRSQGVSRREFFRRYDLVEAEAQALQRAGAPVPGAPESPASDAAASGPAEGATRWPEEIRDVLGKVESFVQATFHPSRPIAQGAVEIGDAVVFFRVLPKGLRPAESSPEEPRDEAASPPEPPRRPAPSRRRKKP
jgi:transcriptional regulator with XRE-family HTH domain